MERPPVMTTATSTNRHELLVILIVAVLQGWALYGLHYAVTHERWPATNLAWLLSLYAVALIVPVSLQLLVQHSRARFTYVLLAGVAAAFFYFSWHHGSAILSFDKTVLANPDELVPLAPEFALLWLMLMPFVQCKLSMGRWLPPYQQLFSTAWRNHLTLAEAGAFTGLFWALLGLWQILFKMLGINFFTELFRQPIFIYPVTAIVFGLALFLIGSLEHWTQLVLEQILSVLKWLGVMAGLILVLFTLTLLVKLPDLLFTGQRAIGAAWLLWLVAIVVLLINAAFRDGTLAQPYPKWIGIALRLSMPLLVVVAATASYALLVRTNKYGLTVERVWAFVVAGTALLYAIGYTIAAIDHERWMASIAKVNIGVALSLIAVIALMLTPLLSPYRLAANSQYQRTLADMDTDATVEATDRESSLLALRFDTGSYGRERLAKLTQSNNQKISQRAIAMQKQQTRWVAQNTRELHLDGIAIYPVGRSLNASLQKYIETELAKPTSGFQKETGANRLAGLYVDLNADGKEEFILFANTRGFAYQETDTGWQTIGTLATANYAAKLDELRAAFEKNAVSTEANNWRTLVIDKYRFRFSNESLDRSEQQSP